MEQKKIYTGAKHAAHLAPHSRLIALRICQSLILAVARARLQSALGPFACCLSPHFPA
jgi:hypothetical protein